jgi:uncharacterized protein YaeQ
MALTATIYNFDIELADQERHVYESLTLRVARHPSESEEYLVARLIAYLLEYAEGIEFSRGVSSPDEPTIAIRDLTGALRSWIDIGTPDAERLHKASKLYAIDRALVGALVARLERRVALTVSVSGGDLYVAIGSEQFTGSIVRL